MARGNHVDGVRVVANAEVIRIYPESPFESFVYYKKLYISKGRTLIGLWGKKPFEYKDYLFKVPAGFDIAEIKDFEIILKKIVKSS